MDSSEAAWLSAADSAAIPVNIVITQQKDNSLPFTSSLPPLHPLIYKDT